MYSNYLMHHGVKGQKWGVRNYQNEDGSYKSGAKGRYDDDSKVSRGVTKALDAPIEVVKGVNNSRIVRNSHDAIHYQAKKLAKNRGIGKIIVKGILRDIGITALGEIAAEATYATTGSRAAYIALQGATGAALIGNTATTITAAVQKKRGKY